MKRFFVDGIEITEEEARKIERKNTEYLNSGDFEAMLNIKLITVI